MLRIKAQIDEIYHETTNDLLGDPQFKEVTKEFYEETIDVTVTEYDNLNKVLDFMARSFEYELRDEKIHGGLEFDYNNSTNRLEIVFTD